MTVGDAFVAQFGAREDGVVGIDQILVAAPVDAECGLGCGLAGGGEVGIDVGAPEGVDGLLGIADQHEGGAPLAEGHAHDVPLDRIGVLELVDQGHAVVAAQPVARGRAPCPVAERVAEPGEQIVVGHHPGLTLAGFDLLAHGDGQALTHRPDLIGVALARLNGSKRVVDGDAPDALRLGQGKGRIAPTQELAQVQVVDDVDHQVTEVLDEGHLPLDVTRHAQAAQHVLAEPMGRGDGCRVEIGEGLGHEPAPPLQLGVRSVGQDPENGVVGRRADTGPGPGEAVLGRDQALPDPVTQLAGRHAGERHQQQFLERDARCHIAGGQGGDGEGLARARARLQHRHACRERPADVEAGHRREGAHRWTRSSHESRLSQSRRAKCPRRLGSAAGSFSCPVSSRGMASNCSKD